MTLKKYKWAGTPGKHNKDISLNPWSQIDVRKILKAARDELHDERPECYLIVSLALQGGLRRAEIDSLLWRSVDLVRRVIHVESNEFFHLKSENSQGEVDIGDSLLEDLKRFKKQATGEFVVESGIPAAEHQGVGANRCRQHFAFVNDWLCKLGVNGARPLHELRKAAGSIIVQEHGIVAASRFLRPIHNAFLPLQG